MLPHIVIYTDRLIPARFAGYTVGPIILIRPANRGDVGLLEHEKTHVRQFWRNPLFGLVYLLSKRARLRYEAEAYRVQLKYNPDRLALYAHFLATKYKLDITEEEALAVLKG
jgi:hypothetical protein